MTWVQQYIQSLMSYSKVGSSPLSKFYELGDEIVILIEENKRKLKNFEMIYVIKFKAIVDVFQELNLNV